MTRTAVTPRELEVLQAIERGVDNRDAIAERLHISRDNAQVVIGMLYRDGFVRRLPGRLRDGVKIIETEEPFRAARRGQA